MEHFPSSICPSNPRTLPLVKSLIRQIVHFHPDIQYLHIGADEVWHLGLCSVCTKRAASSKYGKPALYLEHISAVAQFVQETYPYLKIIIWDDMLRSIDMQVLNGISIICLLFRAAYWLVKEIYVICRSLYRQICGAYDLALQSSGQFCSTSRYDFRYLILQTSLCKRWNIV